jgi:hypothetical protein
VYQIQAIQIAPVSRVIPENQVNQGSLMVVDNQTIPESLDGLKKTFMDFVSMYQIPYFGPWWEITNINHKHITEPSGTIMPP